MEPKFFQWDITDHCNLNCSHCRAGLQNREPRELSAKEIDDVIGQLTTIQFEACSIGGGEPILSPFLDVILEKLHRSIPDVTLLSNGTGFTDEKIDSIRQHDTLVQISLDGDQRVHDSIRGSGVFGRVLAAMDLLRGSGVRFSTKMTLMPLNLRVLKDVLCCSKIYGATSCHVRICIAVGNAVNMKLEKEILKSSILEAADTAREIGIDLIFEDRFLQILANGEGHDLTPGGCGAGIDSMYVAPNGDVLFCPYLPIYCGNLLAQTIQDIWCNSTEFNSLRNIRANKKGKCAICRFIGMCGGCPAQAFAFTGDIFESDPNCPL